MHFMGSWNWIAELVTLDSLRFLEEADCRDMGIIDNTELRIIMSEIDRYKRFSSVEGDLAFNVSGGHFLTILHQKPSPGSDQTALRSIPSTLAATTSLSTRSHLLTFSSLMRWALRTTIRCVFEVFQLKMPWLTHSSRFFCKPCNHSKNRPVTVLKVVACYSINSISLYLRSAMTYWLRDLEMEHYNLTFAKRGLTDLEDLILLLDQVPFHLFFVNAVSS